MKWMTLVLAACLLLSLTACGGPNEQQSEAESSSSVPETSQQSAPNEAESSAPAQGKHDAVEPDKVAPLTPPDAVVEAPDDGLFAIVSNGTSVTQSGSFTARDGDALVLTVDSTVVGGNVDFFLFDPDNNEHQKISFGTHDNVIVHEIALRAGTWAYNCTGFFDTGTFSMTAEIV